MRNEDALLDAMRHRGFEIVVPGALTLTEQIRVFREASVVVGPHGAGLTNIVFCEPGTIVYELVPDHYPNICFGNLALICGLRTGRIVSLATEMAIPALGIGMRT